MKKSILLAIALIFTSNIAFAESRLKPGTSLLDDLKSSSTMANPAGNISGESLVGDAANPASSAYKQRITFDLNYTGVVGNDFARGANPIAPVQLGYYANMLNLGLALPSKAGVFTLSGEYFQGNSYHYDFGHIGFLNFSYSNDLTQEFSFGLGFNLGLGQNSLDSSVPLWAFMIDAGFIHNVKNVDKVSDLRYGIAFKNIGWGTLATEQRYLALFTPEVNVSFTAAQTENFKFGIAAGLELPTFQNLKIGLGMSFAFKDVFRIDLGSRLDVAELAGLYNFEQTKTYSSLLPSVNFIYRYKAKNVKEADDKSFSELHLKAGISPAARNDLWAYSLGFTVPIGVYDNFPPEIFVDFESMYNYTPEIEADAEEPNPSDYDLLGCDNFSNTQTIYSALYNDKKSKNIIQASSSTKVAKSFVPASSQKPEAKASNIRIYVAPNNNGINDNLIIPLKITDKRFISGYNFIVEDEEGNIVRIIGNKEQREENKKAKDYFKKSGINVPDKIIWDCTTEDGLVAEDGIYYFYIEAWDDNHNKSFSPRMAFIIDTRFPNIDLKQPSGIEKIFNSTNVGVKNSLQIVQDGSVEDLWIMKISNTFLGVVFEEKIYNSSPRSFTWGGTDNNGVLLPDGVYTYSIASRDRAGNYTEAFINNIIINTQETPIRINVSDNYLSPNNDGVKDEVQIFLDVPVKDGIINWKFEIVNSRGLAIYNIAGEDDVIDSLIFGNDLIGRDLSEDNYIANLEVLYTNGNNPKAKSTDLIVDLTEPRARISAEYDVFSPDGDGNKDSNRFYSDTSVEDLWIAEISKKDSDDIVAEFKYINDVPVEFLWDGYLPDGKIIPDGFYNYKLYSTDNAGNYGESNILTFQVDTKDTPVELRVARKAFSPNGDGIFDKLEIFPILLVEDGVENCKINIIDNKGEIVREITDSSDIAASYFWDGFNNRGDSALDGEYSATLQVIYKNGNDEKAVSRKFLVDREAPRLDYSYENLVFSPDADGLKDEFIVKANSSREDKWIAQIFNSKNALVKDYVWNNQIRDFKWDGKDNKGNKVLDGKYSMKISSEDEAGNKTLKTIDNITVDTRPTAIFVTVDKRAFSPNNDNILDTLVLETLINITDGIKDWKLEIRDHNNKTYKSFKSDRGIPNKLTWDGKNDKGQIIEGRYKAYFEVEYEKGNNPVTLSDEVLLDITAPAVKIALNPVPFSPDNDGIDDTLDINFDLKDRSGIRFWKYEIFDPKGNLFKVFEGFGDKVNKITWDGRSDTGEFVFSAEDYKYTMTVFDNVANKAVTTGIIPVDILVIKDGNKLKIQIANINFAADSAELQTKDVELAAKNNQVLKRLAEILKKYDNYKITVEGHANAVKWYNEEARKSEETLELQPLSLARAQTVINILTSLGIKPERLNAVGIGGTKPIIDAKKNEGLWNKENWKNRRVEFILER